MTETLTAPPPAPVAVRSRAGEERGVVEQETPSIRLFTVEEYHILGEIGVIAPEERVELINGHVFAMSPVRSLHASTVQTLSDHFYDHVRPNAVVRVQQPIRVSSVSEPEPDVALVHPDRYRAAHPTPEQTYLVIEVSDSTLRTDRLYKIPMYAQAGVPEVWIVALPESAVFVYRAPTADGYASVQRVSGDGEVAPEAFPQALISARAILEGV